MKLNVYEKKKIIKTYETDTYDLMFGTLEDVADALELDKLETGSNSEIIKMATSLVINSKETVKNLLKDIFEGITDEEIKNTKVKEIATVFVDVVKYTIQQLNIIPKSKN